MRNFRYHHGAVLDQWNLIHVVLCALRETTAQTWKQSFENCNLNPHTRVSFPEWCKRIEPFLQKGGTFKTDLPIDQYCLLPAYWHGTSPVDKKKIYETIQSCNGQFTVECVKKLETENHIRSKDLHSLRACYELALEFPEHLNLGCPTEIDASVNPTSAIVDEAMAGTKKINANLNTFLLKPDGMRGEELFNNMIKFRNRRYCNDDMVMTPSASLAIDIDKTQKSIIRPTTRYYVEKSVINCASGDGARLKLAKRKLTSLSYLQGESGVQNDPKRLRRMKNQLELTASMAEIKRVQKVHEQSELLTLKIKYNEGAPAAAKKHIESKNTTKVDICCLLFSAFGKFHKKEAHSKKELKELLQAEIDLSEVDHIHRLIYSADERNHLQGIELDNMLPAHGSQTFEDLPTFASGDHNDDDMNNDGNMDGNDTAFNKIVM